MRGAVCRPIPDRGEVHRHQVVVPVVVVNRVVARPFGALQVVRPAHAGTVELGAQLAGVDRVEVVLLERVVERDAERAPTLEREVVAVTRVLLGV